jgi:hypothetical protein
VAFFFGSEGRERVLQRLWVSFYVEACLVKRKHLVMAAVVGMVVMTMNLAAHGASSLSVSLTSFTGDTTQAGTQAAIGTAGLNVFSTAAGPAVTFDAGGAHFGTAAAGDGGRNYLRTNDSDYVTVSFVAEITFETTSDDQAIFFGVGSGDTALFGTPDWSTQFSSASFWPESANNKFVRFRTANDVNAFADTLVTGGLDPGTHRFRMTYNPATNQLVGEIDKNYAGGPFAADAVSSNLPIDTSMLFASDGWPSEPSRIFFGGDDNAVFRDLTITVVPEPATAVLAVLGLFAASVGRCRRGPSR